MPRARAEDAVVGGEPLGALHGLPVAVKDNTLTAGIRTTFASPLFKDFVPAEDAEVVRRLKAAGAIVLGKTNMPEFAAGANTNNALFGATRNPWNPALTPAGSSGGSAVAVATGMVPLAQGTDFGCSIRMPGGVLRHRRHPSDARLDAEHSDGTGLGSGPGARPAGARHRRCRADARRHRRLQPAVADFSHAALAKRARRARAAQGCARACASPTSPTSPGSASKREIDGICREAALGLSQFGAQVEETAFDASGGRNAYQTWRGFWMVGQFYPRLSELDQFGPNLKGNIAAGLKLTALDFAAAEQKRQETYHRFRTLFERFDVLLTPAAPVKPFPVEKNFPDAINGRSFDNYTDWFASSYLVTLVSLPAASAPAGLSADGLPVGMQIIAPRFEEPMILSVARLLHQASGVGWPPIAAAAGANK